LDALFLCLATRPYLIYIIIKILQRNE